MKYFTNCTTLDALKKESRPGQSRTASYFAG